jgi:hypothetical protein
METAISKETVLRGQIEHHEALKRRGEASMAKSELKQISAQLETLMTSLVEQQLVIEQLRKEELTVAAVKRGGKCRDQGLRC